MVWVREDHSIEAQTATAMTMGTSSISSISSISATSPKVIFIMKPFPFLFLAVLSLSGCFLTTATPPQSLTVQQAYFAELSAYYVLLGTAGQYKDDCMVREAHLQQDCRVVVQKLRDM